MLTFAAGAQAAPQAAGGSGLRAAGTPTAGTKVLQHASAGSGGNQLDRAVGLGKRPEIQVDENLLRQLTAGDRRDFAIEFSARPDLSAAYGMDWQARGRYVTQRLKEAAERSQAEVIAHLRAQGVRFNTYYAKNVILVREGDLRTMQGVLTFQGVERVRIPPQMGLILPDELAKAKTAKIAVRPEPARAKTLGTNIEWVQADDVWAMGVTGVGAVVGSIDSGVRFDHEALVQQYRGNLGGGNFNHNHNWLDPEGGSPFPAPASSALPDQHGTHTTGTMVGDDHDPNEANRDRVGMAPDAKWIACQGFPTSGSVDAALLACGEFMLAPTDLAGGDADPDLRPMAVNNSWGNCPANGALDDFYDDVIDAWNAAGIIPVFSNGNASNCNYPEPPGLATVGSPGSSPFVFGVGSTGNANGEYAVHSNWGPTQGINPGLPNFPDNGGYPQLKPNVVSPGENIRSTIGTSTTGYDSSVWSGTSMSAPHITGLMALMFDAAPCLVGDFGRVGTIIQQTARPIDYDSGSVPGVLGPGPGNIPNFATGWGEIDALDAVNAAMEECGPQGFIAGQVTAEGPGLPIAGALVEIFIDENVRIYSTTTDANGNYTRRVPVPDVGQAYTVRASRYGFLTETVANVPVTEGQTTTQNLQLEAADTFTVSGVVTDAVAGWPLHARIDIDGYPNGPVWSDPVTGAYSVELVEGIEYAFATTASLPGYLPDARDVGPLVADVVIDIGLQPNLTTCAAPGYVASTALQQDFEAGTPPAGWTETNVGASANNGWLFGTALNSADFAIPAHTRYAAANDDRCGSNATQCNASQDYLISPVFSLAGMSTPSLRFESFYTAAFGSTGSVQYSIDGGGSWLPLGVPATGSWTPQAMSLAAAAGQANVRLRFHHNDGGAWASGWAIDNVQVTGTCAAPATGGLLSGRVLDGNTGQGLDGAVVTVAGGGTATSATSADPAIGAGFYTVFAPAGSPLASAAPGSLPAGYTGDSDTVTIVTDQVTEHDFELEAGQLSFSPANGPSATIPFGTTSLQQFGVTNSGQVAVNYAILAPLANENFEDGVPPAGWTAQDVGATSCPWLTNEDYGLDNYAGGQGLSATVNSDACGQGSVVDARLVSPTFDLTGADAARLDFVLAYQHTGTANRFDVEVSTDAGATWTALFTQAANLSPTGPGAPISIDLTPYAGAPSLTLRLRYRSGWAWHVQVDQLRVSVDTSPLPWLSFANVLGSLTPGQSRNHPMQFRADHVPQPGTYTAPLTVIENTPYPAPALQATLTATTPASFGTISGTITSQGYCDENPAPLAGATVSIQGSAGVGQATTDANGNYTWQVDASQGPFTVTASGAGHLAASASGIALSPGGNADVDLAPRLAQPCFSVAESSISVTQEQGDIAQRLLNLANDGAAAADPWQVTVGGDATPADGTLTQSLSHDVLPLNTIACANQTTGATTENSFLRVYTPAGDGYSGNVTLRGVSFAVETAEAAAGGAQDVEVAVYALEGPIEGLDVTLLASETYTVSDGDGTTHSVPFTTPVTVPAGTQVLVELYSADEGNVFYPGSNADGETQPGYILAPGCGLSVATFDAVGFPDVDIILDLDVTGSQLCGASVTPVDWLEVDPASGTLAAGGTQQVEVDVSAVGKAVGTYNAALCVAAADAGNPLTIIPATMNVLADAPDVELSIAVTDSADPVVAGTDLSYAVAVANAGPSAANGVAVTAVLDAGLAYDGYTGAGWTCAEAAGTVSCQLAGSVAAGASAAALSIEVTPITAGTRSSTFTVGATEEDANTGNDSDTETTVVTAAPNVDVTLNASLEPGSVAAGTPVRLRITAANFGADAATGVEVAIALPANVSYASSSGAGWSCVAGAGNVVCTLAGSLAQGFAPPLDVMLATAEPAGSFDIEATIAAAQADGNAANNSATVQLTVTPASAHIFGGAGSGGGGFED